MRSLTEKQKGTLFAIAVITAFIVMTILVVMTGDGTASTMPIHW